MARPAAAGEDRQHDDGADRAGAGQQVRRTSKPKWSTSGRTRGRLRRQGREGQDRARSRVGRPGLRRRAPDAAPSARSAPAAPASTATRPAPPGPDRLVERLGRARTARASAGRCRSGSSWTCARLLERGQKVVMRAHIRTRTYPGKMNVVSAAIPGTANPERGRADPRRARVRDDRDAGRERQLHGRGDDPRGGPDPRPADQGRHAAEAGAHHPLPLGARDLGLERVHVQAPRTCRTSCSSR